ncbi:hypothetical protein GN316_16545 [Xylophilus sp. Kf1]|nr:hypothetical protein [Xylophilus sp. Kf1]
MSFPYAPARPQREIRSPAIHRASRASAPAAPAPAAAGAGADRMPAFAAAYHPLQAVPSMAAHNHYFAPAPSYPASNMPGMWNRLGPYIARSPTLARQLAQLAQTGWTVLWKPNEGCLCHQILRQIHLNPALSDSVVMQYLAHETNHAFDTPMDARFFATDVDFATAKMRDEAKAVVNHMRVRSEIYQGEGHDIGYAQADPAYYESAIRFHQWHGNDERLLQHIQRLMSWEMTGVHNRPYWEVYLNVWRTGRGLPPVAVPPGMCEIQRAQAHASLSREMGGG